MSTEDEKSATSSKIYIQLFLFVHGTNGERIALILLLDKVNLKYFNF